MIDGIELKLGEREYIVPPLNLKRVRKLLPILQDVIGKPVNELTEEQIDSLSEVVFQALQRNYPNITKEEVEDIIDFKNLRMVVGAVLGQNRLSEPNPISPLPVERKAAA
jgi:hypothetical protein